MKIVKIPKKSKGEFRTIYVCSPEEKEKFYKHLPALNNACEAHLPQKVSHGFMPGKSPVTNALAHVGYSYTLCVDLKDFFESVKESHLKGLVSDETLKEVIVDGSVKQGLPTSPAAANLAASKMDKSILNRFKKLGLDILYTRYADDLSFSFNDHSLTSLIIKEVKSCAGRCGFKINPKKTRLMAAKSGRRVICGVAVGETSIHPTRKVKRKLRAALHKKNLDQIRGLKEWINLKVPKDKNQKEFIQRQKNIKELVSLAQIWNLKLPKDLTCFPDRETEFIDHETIITGDLVYIVGMSTFTNGWRSCMTQPDGCYREGVLTWLHLRGTRIAALLSDKGFSIAGVYRKQMKARVLVHTLRNGINIYDKIYGNPNEISILQTKLEKAGIISVEVAKEMYKGQKVVGHVPAETRTPYLDNLSLSSAIAKTGKWAGKKVYTFNI